MVYDHFAPSHNVMALMRRVWGNIGKWPNGAKEPKMGKMAKNTPKIGQQILSSYLSLYPVLGGHFAPSRIAQPLMIRIWANMGILPNGHKGPKIGKTPKNAPKMNISDFLLFYHPILCFRIILHHPALLWLL